MNVQILEYFVCILAEGYNIEQFFFFLILGCVYFLSFFIFFQIDMASFYSAPILFLPHSGVISFVLLFRDALKSSAFYGHLP